MPLLEDRVIAARLQSMPQWKLDSGELVRHCQFENFIAAIDSLG